MEKEKHPRTDQHPRAQFKAAINASSQHYIIFKAYTIPTPSIYVYMVYDTVEDDLFIAHNMMRARRVYLGVLRFIQYVQYIHK